MCERAVNSTALAATHLMRMNVCVDVKTVEAHAVCFVNVLLNVYLKRFCADDLWTALKCLDAAGRNHHDIFLASWALDLKPLPPWSVPSACSGPGPRSSLGIVPSDDEPERTSVCIWIYSSIMHMYDHREQSLRGRQHVALRRHRAIMAQPNRPDYGGMFSRR